MVDALNVVGDIDKIVIIISGDCAFSGSESEYKYVWSIVGNIIKNFKKAFHSTDYIEVLTVPGNHDMDFSKGSLTVDDLNDIYITDTYNKELPQEIDKLANYFNFAKYNKCFIKNSIYDYRIINFGGYKIQFDLINSALFSIKDKEDKGLHYIPSHCIDSFSKPTDTDLSVVVMHHAPEWFCDNTKHLFEEAIMKKSSVAFFGHEHYLDCKESQSSSTNSTLILTGGALCNGCNWLSSSFFAGVLDTNDTTYQNWQFCWDGPKRMYEHKKLEKHTITPKHNQHSFHYTKSFYESFIHDSKRVSGDNYKTRFIFPRLIDEKPKNEITTIEQFKLKLLESKRIIVMGNYNSGRTYFLKFLFDSFIDEKIALYIDVNTINGSKIDKVIKNEFEDTYGEDPELFMRFQQAGKESKMLLLDNIDCIPTKQFKAFIKKIDETFGYYIFSSKQYIEFDIFERIKQEIGNESKIEKYTIAPWYSDKRKQLISIIASAELPDNDTLESITNQLNLSIRSQQTYFNLNPDFITQFVEYYCKNLSQLQNNDSSVFGKVFEANITNQIRKNITKTISVDKIFTILAKIAYCIHISKEYPVSENKISNTIAAYNDVYGDTVSYVDIINIVTRSSIMFKNDESNTYRFTNKSYLPYFIAKEINQKYNDDRDETDIKNILNYSCFGINADILMFLIYITDNRRILDLILNMVKVYTESWKEFNFKNHDIDYLSRTFAFKIKKLEKIDIEKIDKETIEEEKAVSQADVFNTINIYDYSEDESEELVNQFIRAIALLSTISKCLPCFEHNMKKADKEAFVSSIYTLPNKIFYLWAKNTDDNREEIIKFIWHELVSSYDKQEDQKALDEMKNKAVAMLIMDSTSMLLDIYNMAVQFSTKDNTLGYLSEFSYKEDDTYFVQHLMMLSNRNKVADFINEADEILKRNKGKLPSLLVQRVANHALYSMKNLNYQTKARLIQKCFPNTKNPSLLLTTKQKDTPND